MCSRLTHNSVACILRAQVRFSLLQRFWTLTAIRVLLRWGDRWKYHFYPGNIPTYLRMFGKASVELSLALGSLVPNSVYPEAEAEFQQMSYFTTSLRLQNTSQQSRDTASFASGAGELYSLTIIIALFNNCHGNVPVIFCDCQVWPLPLPTGGQLNPPCKTTMWCWSAWPGRLSLYNQLRSIKVCLLLLLCKMLLISSWYDQTASEWHHTASHRVA